MITVSPGVGRSRTEKCNVCLRRLARLLKKWGKNQESIYLPGYNPGRSKRHQVILRNTCARTGAVRLGLSKPFKGAAKKERTIKQICADNRNQPVFDKLRLTPKCFKIFCYLRLQSFLAFSLQLQIYFINESFA